ncbi:MAG: hypothetical protein M0P38_08915 [Bacteroidales bacterium]|nr:hypothetical protein [Bacteroidales bacterium]
MYRSIALALSFLIYMGASCAQSYTNIQLCYGDSIEIPIPQEFVQLETHSETNEDLFVAYGYLGADTSLIGSYVSIIGCINCNVGASASIDDCDIDTTKIVNGCILYRCPRHYIALVYLGYFNIEYVFPIESYDIFAPLISNIRCWRD